MTLMNSDRQNLQLYIEESIHCTSSDQLKENKKKFLEFTVTHSNLHTIQGLQREDAASLFQKGMQSYFQGVEDLLHGYESWAVIKLYYSTYYFLRCELAMNGFSILRCPDICILTSKTGETPSQAGRKNRSNDHKSTIEIFKDKIGRTDILLSQSIESQTSYDWLSGMREWANYRSANFPEILDKRFFYSPSIFGIGEKIDLFINDDQYIYCFDKDFACLALPSKRAQLTARNFERAGLTGSKRFKNFMASRIKKSQISQHLKFIGIN